MFTVSARALKSPKGKSGPFSDYVNRPSGISAQQFKSLNSGTKTVAVILVDFSSAGSDTSGAIYQMTDDDDIDDISNIQSYFKGGTKNFENYYEKVSYGEFIPNVTFAVKGGTRSTLEGVKSTHPFTMPRSTMSWYGEDTQKSLETLIKDALFVSSVSTDNYDYVIVAHAGYGNESTYPSYLGDIWSASVGFSSGRQNGFTTGAIVPARESGGRSPFGVICHEFGHQLGLPDIYEPDTGNSVVGEYAIMDRGNWNDDGNTPSLPCSWSREYLGWVDPAASAEGSPNRLNPYCEKAVDSVYKFSVEGTGGYEYFLLSYRKKGGYDSALPAEGPLFLHIDDSIGSVEDNTANYSTQSHHRIELAGYGIWDVTEVFTAPYSNLHNGTVSGITVYGFYNYSSYYTFEVTLADFTADGGFKEKPLNYPNPVESGEVKTTISFKIKEPESEKTIRIYTPAGKLVKKIKKDYITPVYVQDNEVVYQADWNLNNESGRSVSSGIYMYHVEAGSNDDFGTVVIIR